MVKLKKAIAILLLAMFLLSILSARQREIFVAASPGTIHVFPAAHPTVQEAINSANPGDMILVHKGTYYEDIVINKSVSLIGEERDLTIIYGSEAPQPQYVVNVIASPASVKDLTIRARTLIQSSIIVGSAGNIVENNRIEGGFYGLQLSLSRANVISDNIISNNQYGVLLYASSHNVFSGNIIANNVAVGIELHSSDDNMFSGNTICDNPDGLNLYSSVSGNVFYHNNFNNTSQLTYDSMTASNVWSLNGEGNYWSDYAGRDLNGDGIGDSAYNHTDTEGGDSYPLMGPFYDLGVVLKSQIYDINLISNSTISGLRFEIGEETGNRIVRFNVAGEEGTVGFCRIMIPLGLMDSPFIVLGIEGEIIPALLKVSDETNVCLYFTWVHSNQTISIVSSKTLRLYNELLDKYANLLADLYILNATHNSFLENYSTLLGSLRELQKLNTSYYGHLSDYSRNVDNIQNLLYVFAATTAIFLVTTVYLSKRAHTGRGSESSKRKNSAY